jgi:hypothetical protein
MGVLRIKRSPSRSDSGPSISLETAAEQPDKSVPHVYNESGRRGGSRVARPSREACARRGLEHFSGRKFLDS